jgi:AcrR family transcriptional regulator
MKSKKKAIKSEKPKVRSVKKRTRKYDNTVREKKSDLNRQKIIESYVDLLVASNGHEVTLQTLAKKTKISLRTLFRFFGDKERLNEEIELYLTRYLSSISNELDRLSVADYAEFSYQVFDRYEKLVKAYLYTNLGQLSRRVLRKKFYDLLGKKIVSEVLYHRGRSAGAGEVTPEDMVKIRFTANLISAQIWSDLKEGYKLNGKTVAPAARWAIHTLLKDLYITL